MNFTLMGMFTQPCCYDADYDGNIRCDGGFLYDYNKYDFVYKEGTWNQVPCPKCKGTGKVLTEDAEELIDLILALRGES